MGTPFSCLKSHPLGEDRKEFDAMVREVIAANNAVTPAEKLAANIEAAETMLADLKSERKNIITKVRTQAKTSGHSVDFGTISDGIEKTQKIPPLKNITIKNTVAPIIKNNRESAIASLSEMTNKGLREVFSNAKQQYMKKAAADMLRTRSEKVSTTRSEVSKRMYAKEGKVDSSKDTMSHAIGKLGGISSASAKQRLRLAPEEFKSSGHGIRKMFTSSGRSIDEMGAVLADLGYIDRDENGKYDQADFEEKLTNAISGVDVLTPEGMMISAERNHAAAMEEVGASTEKEYQQIENYVDQSDDAIQAAIDAAFDSDQEIRTYTDEDIDAIFGIASQNSRVHEVNPAKDASSSNQGNQAEGFNLESETESSARSRIESESKLSQSEIDANRKYDNEQRQRQIHKEINARQDASAENFQLGQSAEDSLSGQEGFKFSKTEQQNNRHTVESIRPKLDEALARYGKNFTQSLIDTNKFRIIDSKQAAIILGGKPEGIAFFDSKTGVTHIIADKIGTGATTEELHGLMLHEVANHALELGRSKPEFQKILRDLEMMNRAGNKETRSAFAHAKKAGESQSNMAEEALGYLLEQHSELSIAQRALAFIRQIIRSMGNSLPVMKRSEWFKSIDTMSVKDLTYAAQKALQSAPNKLANTEEATSGEGSFASSKTDLERNLVITHNLTEDNLLHANKMGGIAVPSLAVTKADSTMSGFGEITLIGSKELADPKGYAKTKVFGADIYSPRYPSIDYKISGLPLKKINQKLAELNAKFNIGEIFGSNLNGDVLRNLTDLNSVKAAALQEKGIDVEPVMVNGKVDSWKSTMALRTAMQENDLYGIDEKFAKKLLESAGAEEQIFKGYSSSGNKQYTPHTLENVVKILKKELRGGENFNYGAGSLRAKFTPEFKTIADIRNNRERLTDSKTFEKIKEEINSDLSAVDKAFGTTRTETTIAILEDAPKMGLDRAAKQYNIVLGENAKEMAAEFLTKLETLPTEYFEAKILRDVSLSEFSGAVIPKNASAKTREILDRAGVQYREYDGEGNRTKAVQEFTSELNELGKNILFSKTVKSNLLEAWQLLASSESTFRYAKNRSKDMREVFGSSGFKDYSIEEEKTDVGDRWIITAPKDSKKSNVPIIVSTNTKDKSVWINTAFMKEGQNDGSMIYQATADWAFNNDFTFIGDPEGLSDVAVRRRTEQMLASAMKHGTTDHLMPHDRQVFLPAAEREKLGVRLLDWEPFHTAHNIEEMLKTVHANIVNVMPEAANLTYSVETGQYLLNGKEQTNDMLSELSKSAGARNANAGIATLKRAAITNTILQEEMGEGGGSVLRGLRDVIERRDNNTGGNKKDDSLARISYSRSTNLGFNQQQREAADRVFGQPKTRGERMQEFTKDWKKNIVQGVFDVYAPVKELSQKAYIQLRMSRGGDSTLEALMLYGKVSVDRDGYYQVDYKKENGKQGFAQTLSKLEGEHDRFFKWVSALRAERLSAIGLENLMSKEDIAALKTLNRERMPSGKSREMAYATALKEFMEFNDSVLKIAVDSGLIDEATRKMYENTPYVPFYRLQEEGSAFGMKAGAVNQSAWKKLKGGTAQLNDDLLANTLQNWSHLITASAKNRAAKTTIDAAVGAGVAESAPSGTKGAVHYREGGKERAFLVSDEHVMDAITAMEYAGLGPWATPLVTMKRMLTIGVTMSPTFKIRNLIRDSIHSIGVADVSYNPLANVKQGWIATAEDSETRAQMLASGGMIRFGSMLDGNSSKAAQDIINKNVDSRYILDSQSKIEQLWNKTLKPAFDAYQELGDRGEQANRAALYEILIKSVSEGGKGMSHGEAAYMARDMMDFSSTGKWTAIRFLTQVVPFMNARLQGLYKLGRASQDGETWKIGKAELSKRLGYTLGTVSLSSIALMLAYKDDDDWKKREDSDRQTYWWFKIGDTAYRIPKPFEIGSVGTIAEMGIEYFATDDMDGKRFMSNLGTIVGHQLNMNPIPQLVKPMLDVYANKDSFTGRPIETMAMQRLKAEDRYSERTSELARFLGGLGLPDPVMGMMGHYNELSPVKIDSMIRGYFGWLGTMASVSLDYGIRPMADRADKPSMQLKDVFLVGSFAESLPTGSSRYVSEMYNQAAIIEQAYASYHEALKRGDMEKAKTIYEEDKENLAKYSRVAGIKRTESKIGAQIKMVTASRAMTPDQKREALDELYVMRDRVAMALVD